MKWAIEHHQLAHETRASAGSFGDYDAHGDTPSFVELYDGVVAVSTDDPGRAWSDSEARFELRFPEATCSAHVTMRVESDRSDYHVKIHLTVSEDGRELWTRDWDRTIPRDLA